MIVGLLFATSEAEDRPGVLAATLPFGASTLIEHQARLLQNAGATHVVVVVQRLTPELLAAIARLTRRGLTVDTARFAADVLARAHPLARLVMVADALVTTDTVVRAFAEGSGDLLLTVAPDAPGATALERLGAGTRWGGVARLDHARLVEAAALPADYDLQSTLLRAAEQAGARHLALTDAAAGAIHGVERRAAALETRGRAALATSIRPGARWFDRYVTAPLARWAIPMLARRGVPSRMAALAGGATSLLGLILVAAGFAGVGLVAALIGAIMLSIVSILADARDEDGLAQLSRVGPIAVGAAALALVAWRQGDVVAIVLAAAGLANGGLAERAVGAVRRRGAWWMSPAGALAALTLVTLAREPLAGIAIVAVYATATLAAAIEALRREA